MHLAQTIYPELQTKYQFELPSDYDYRTLGSHEMPDDIYQIFEGVIQQQPEQPE